MTELKRGQGPDQQVRGWAGLGIGIPWCRWGRMGSPRLLKWSPQAHGQDGERVWARLLRSTQPSGTLGPWRCEGGGQLLGDGRALLGDTHAAWQLWQEVRSMYQHTY